MLAVDFSQMVYKNIEYIRRIVINRKIFFSRIGFEIFKTTFKSWRIVFFGSDHFSIVSLTELLKERNKKVICSLEVVTTNCRNPVYQFSLSNDIKVHFWPPKLIGFHDLGIVVSFGKFIPKEIIDFFPLGIINVHASLLPRWRGAMPIFHAIKNGDKITGITIQKISPHAFDVGDTILKRPCSIGEHELFPSLYNRLSRCGSECLIKVIQELPDSLEICEPQDNEAATYAKKLSKDLLFVKWNEMTAEEVYNLYRSLPSSHYLKTMWKQTCVRLLCMSKEGIEDSFCKREIEKGNESKIPGSLIYMKNKILLVHCQDKPIRICTVKINGKLYEANNFYRGFLSQCPSSDWIFGL